MNQSREPSIGNVLYKIVIYLVTVSILMALESLFLFATWNIAIINIFTPLPKITYWQMYLIVIGLSVLSDILKGLNLAGGIE